MTNRATSDLASPFGTFRAGTELPDGAVPDAVLAAWAEAGAIEAVVEPEPEVEAEVVTEPEAATASPTETAVVEPPEAAVPPTPETAVVEPPESR